MLAAQWRGYLELQRAGVIDRLPRMIAVQSVSASPLLDAYRAGADRVGAIEHPHHGFRVSTCLSPANTRWRQCGPPVAQWWASPMTKHSPCSSIGS